MSKGRLEAFSDGVIAIIITIMVLELKVPHGGDLEALAPLLPVFLSYALSFVFIAIYWNNHHHLMHAAERVNGRVLWANVHLLFWLSLVPFVTNWMGENGFSGLSVTLYVAVLWLSGLAYYILARALVGLHAEDSVLVRAIGRDRKGIASLILYSIGIVLSLFSSPAAMAIVVIVAVIWFIPDQRIEKRIAD
jgi:uncharacterized membrane protein